MAKAGARKAVGISERRDNAMKKCDVVIGDNQINDQYGAEGVINDAAAIGGGVIGVAAVAS